MMADLMVVKDLSLKMKAPIKGLQIHRLFIDKGEYKFSLIIVRPAP